MATRQIETSSRRGGVVEDQAVGRARGELVEHVLGRERDQRLLELRGRQRGVRDGRHRGLLHELGRGQERRDPRGHRRVRERVRVRERGRRERGLHRREVGRDRRVERHGRVEREEVREEAGGVRRGHRGAGHGRDRGAAADVRGEDVQAGGEDVDARAVVREVRALVTERRRTDGDGLLRSCRGVVACVLVVVARGDSEVHAGIDSAVDDVVESARLATTERHVGDGALVGSLASALELLTRSLGLRGGGARSPGDTTNDIGHGPGAIAAEHLHSDNVRRLGNTILA